MNWALTYSDVIGPILSGAIAVITSATVYKDGWASKRTWGNAATLAAGLWLGNGVTSWIAPRGLWGISREISSKVIGGAVYGGLRYLEGDVKGFGRLGMTKTGSEGFGNDLVYGALLGFVGDAIVSPFNGFVGKKMNFTIPGTPPSASVPAAYSGSQNGIFAGPVSKGLKPGSVIV